MCKENVVRRDLHEVFVDFLRHDKFCLFWRKLRGGYGVFFGSCVYKIIDAKLIDETDNSNYLEISHQSKIKDSYSTQRVRLCSLV
jgi:hypothetical protein